MAETIKKEPPFAPTTKDGRRKVFLQDPKTGRIMKGNTSGGRQAGHVSIVTLLKEKLGKVPEGQKKTYAELFVDLVLSQALIAKNTRIITDIIDRIDGRAVQSIQLNSDTRIEEALDELTNTINETK